MPTVATPFPTVHPDRDDEPSLRELVRDALIAVGLVPLRDFRTEVTGPTIRVAFLSPAVPALLDVAWPALRAFDCYSDGPSALRVGYAGDCFVTDLAPALSLQEAA